jgi:cyclic pyranopterin phosphate synthase
MALLQDNFGRSHEYLRISVTDTCNFRCVYCLPNGPEAHTSPRIHLSPLEIQRAVAALSKLGVKKVRLTGGEPGLRSDLPDIVQRIANISNINKVAITTNGTAIAESHAVSATQKVRLLQQAGCSQINLSLDSLKAESFERITGRSSHAQIIHAIDAVLAEASLELKINCVLLKDLNSDEFADWLEFVKTRRVTVRFIELMPTSGSQNFYKGRFLSNMEWQNEIERSGWSEIPRTSTAGPAHEYSHPGSLGRIGFISPISKKFCGSCNRLRLTSAGLLHLCAFEGEGHNLRHLLQSPTQEPELLTTLTEALTHKEREHSLLQTASFFKQSFSNLGG